MQFKIDLYLWLLPTLVIGSALGLALTPLSCPYLWGTLGLSVPVAILLFYFSGQFFPVFCLTWVGIIWTILYASITEIPRLTTPLPASWHTGTISAMYRHYSPQRQDLYVATLHTPPGHRVVLIRTPPTSPSKPSSPTLHPGTVVRFLSHLEPLPPYRWPLHPQINQCHGIGSLTPGQYYTPPPATGFWDHTRQHITTHLRKLCPGQAGALATALITGDRTLLSTTTQRNFRTIGLAHLLAISGLHITLVASLTWTILRRGMLIIAPHRLSGSPIKAWAMAGGMMVAGAYTLLSGTEVPAQRAWTVVGLGTAALWYRRLTLPRYVWNIIGTILWLTNPMLIASVPAQLSFLATLGVIATSGRGPLRTTFGATFATLPVILNTFHGLSPYTLLANLFAIPWLSMAVIPLLLGTLLWPAWSACGVEIIYAHLLTAALDMLLLWADRLAHWPLADVYVPKPPLVTILCLTGSVLWWGLVSGAARRWHWIMLICSAITWWACLPTEWTIQTEHGPIYARKSTDGALEISSLADPQITQHFLAVSGLTSARQKVPWVNSRKKCPH